MLPTSPTHLQRCAYAAKRTVAQKRPCREEQGCAREACGRRLGADAHTSTVSSESSPRSLIKCDVATTFAGSTFWKFLTTSITRSETSSLGRNPPEANERDHSAGATRRDAAALARGAMRMAAVTAALRAELRRADIDDILTHCLRQRVRLTKKIGFF